MDPFGGEAGPWDRLANRIYLPRPIPLSDSDPCTSVIATIVIHLLNVVQESCYYRQPQK